MPAPPPPPRRIFFENDGRHPLIYMYEPPIQAEQYESAVDELVGTPVDVLAVGLGDGRTLLHDTRVGELWGHNVARWPHLVFRRAHQNAAHLIAQGLDPLALLCRRARQEGLALYPQLLVNLPCGPRQEDCRCSEFRFRNPHLEIGVPSPLDADGRSSTCLDFAHEAVRAERLALIQEVLQGYDVDGFELQLNHFPFYFHPDRMDAGIEVMTAWIGQVRDVMRISGAERELAVRVGLRICDDLPRWHASGRVHEILLRLRVSNGVETDRLRFRLNGADLPAAARRRIDEIYRMQAPRYRTGPGTWYIFRLDAEHAPVRGVNDVEVTLLARDADILPRPCLRDVEVETRYLMGRGFSRSFSDPDLGPSEQTAS